MKFKELALLFSIPVPLLEKMANAGVISPIQRDELESWECSEEDRRYVYFSLYALKLDFSLAEIASIIDVARSGNIPCDDVRNQLRKKLDATLLQLKHTLTLFERLDKALRLDEEFEYSKDTDYSVCKIIENWAEIYGE